MYHYGWPEDASAFDGVDCVVMYGDGGRGHMVMRHLDEMDALAKKGVGIVCLHYGVEVPKGPAGDKFLEWIGGYFETDWSVNPHWTAKFSSLPDHPITRGVQAVRDQRRMVLSHAVSRGDAGRDADPYAICRRDDSLSRPDGSAQRESPCPCRSRAREPQHMAWAMERPDGGRGFGFTGGHVHWNWADPNFRKLVLNAIVWCAKAEVPPEGVSDAAKTLADMESNHDEKPPARFDREAIRTKYNLPPDDVPPELSVRGLQRHADRRAGG